MVQPSGDYGAGARYDLSGGPPVVRDVDPGAGWIEFAVVLLGMIGILNVISGIGAIGDSKFYAQNAEYVVGSLHTWGWASLLIGVTEVLVALGIWRGNQLARWLGVFALALNAITQLLISPAYPFWSLAVFAVDILTMYGLVVYGERRTAAG